MSRSDVSNRVLTETLSSDEIAPVADPFSFSVLAGNSVHCPKHAALDGTRTATAVKAV